jgi:hypothetical protein
MDDWLPDMNEIGGLIFSLVYVLMATKLYVR